VPTYSREERLAAIKAAGFPDPLTALAVSLAEFGDNRDINTQSQSDSLYANGAREQSFGPWQIHLPAHQDVSQSCAMDLTCSTQAAYAISKGGTDFGPWSAFTSGSYARFLPELNNILPATGSSPTPSGTSASPAGGSCADVPGSIVTSVKISMGALLKVGKAPASVAESLKALYPSVSVACLQSIAYGSATSIKTAPDQQAVAAIGNAVQNATNPLEFFKAFLAPDNIWRASFAVLGGLMIFFGAKLYFHQDVGSEQGVVNA
jgi:Lysozyme like domain